MATANLIVLHDDLVMTTLMSGIQKMMNMIKTVKAEQKGEFVTVFLILLLQIRPPRYLSTYAPYRMVGDIIHIGLDVEKDQLQHLVEDGHKKNMSYCLKRLDFIQISMTVWLKSSNDMGRTVRFRIS